MKQNRKPPRGLDTGGGMDDDAGLGEVKRLRLLLPGPDEWRGEGSR